MAPISLYIQRSKAHLGDFMNDYSREFEDACELALKALSTVRSLEEARQYIMYLLGLVKERKLEAIKRELGVLL